MHATWDQGDNSKVWLQTIQSLVTSPSLSPAILLFTMCERRPRHLQHIQRRGTKQLSEESGTELGFETSQASANRSQEVEL